MTIREQARERTNRALQALYTAIRLGRLDRAAHWVEELSLAIEDEREMTALENAAALAVARGEGGEEE